VLFIVDSPKKELSALTRGRWGEPGVLEQMRRQESVAGYSVHVGGPLPGWISMEIGKDTNGVESGDVGICEAEGGGRGGVERAEVVVDATRDPVNNHSTYPSSTVGTDVWSRS
jgi:hypothetical protein